MNGHLLEYCQEVIPPMKLTNYAQCAIIMQKHTHLLRCNRQTLVCL